MTFARVKKEVNSLAKRRGLRRKSTHLAFTVDTSARKARRKSIMATTLTGLQPQSGASQLPLESEVSSQSITLYKNKDPAIIPVQEVKVAKQESEDDRGKAQDRASKIQFILNLYKKE